MNLSKSQIKHSAAHPSLLLNSLKPQKILLAPLIIDQNGVLIDGYRRFQCSDANELPVFELHTENIVDSAFHLNSSTRLWDEVDCFLWLRWAAKLKLPLNGLPITKFSEQLSQLSGDLLRDLAERRLSLRQVVALLQAPARYRPVLHRVLTEQVALNPNSTAAFIEMATDIANKTPGHDIESIFAMPSIYKVLSDKTLTPQQRGERLLKGIRVMRYPYYEDKSEKFTSSWQRLHLDDIQTRKSTFIERGVLEISFTASSLSELRNKTKRLNDSMESPIWEEFWQPE